MIRSRNVFLRRSQSGDSTDAESAEPEGSNWSRAGRTQVKQGRKNASGAEAEDRNWSRTGGQGNGISDLDNAGLQGLYLHIVDKGSDEDSKLWMKGKASRGGESRCE